LIGFYILVELPLFRWDRALFPKAWLLLGFFLCAGWPFLRQIGRVPLAATLAAVAGLSAVTTMQLLETFRSEAPQTSERVVVDPGAIYSAAPSPGGGALVYEAIASEHYVLRRKVPAGIQTMVFAGDAFHPTQAQQGRSLAFELVRDRTSRVVGYQGGYDAADAIHGSDPALSPDGSQLAFVSEDGLSVARGNKVSLLIPGAVSGPAFFPDGERIVFALGPPGRRQIASVSSTGGPIQTLVSGGDCFQPAVAPNGRWIAYTCSAIGARHVWLRDLTTGRSLRLTNGFCNNDAPAWEPGSRSLVFASDCSRGLGLPGLYRTKLPEGW
jgi:Tol biopolymer transport system component